MSGDAEMREVHEHMAAAMEGVAPLPGERLPVAECVGLVAAERLVSRVDLPGFDNSAMDVYAVQAADLVRAGAGRGRGVRLQVIGELAAGEAPTDAVRPGTAIQIMTGAPLPPGADAVVPVEDTYGGVKLVTITTSVPAGRHIRRRGEDLAAGSVVVSPGDLLTARRIGLLAAAGHGEVLVHPRPRVAVVSTGAELVAPGADLAPGQIYDSNSHLLAAAVTAVGGLTAYRGSIGDDPEMVRAELARLVTQVDVIITSGGVSMGVHDVIKDVLRDSGTVEFVQVAMQPGKPQGLGVLLDGERRVPFFGLPGNPVSAAVSFTIFVRPVLRRMLGLEQPETTTVSAELTAGMRSPAGKVQFARARARMLPNDRLGAEPLAGQGSHFVADLAEANLLLIIPPDTTELSAGDVVHAILLEDDDGGVTAR